MGNFASCTSSPSSHDKQSSPSVLGHTPPAVRVLLIDGSMLRFRVPVKVIKLLLDYPNHVICPLDSLKPGLHSLSSLLPDEKLQLGRLYLLLPFKAKSMQQNCMKSSQVMQKRDSIKGFPQSKEREERKRLLPRDKSEMGLANCAEFSKNGDVGLKLQACAKSAHEAERSSRRKLHAAGKSIEKQKNHDSMLKSEVGNAECSEIYKNGDVGRQYNSRRSAARSYGKLSDESNRARGIRRSTENMGHSSYGKENNVESSNLGPLCDTPELQRAYRSFLLRRSSSWTPRLQPILERRS